MKPVRFRSRAIQNINGQITYFEANAPHVVEPFRKEMRATISLIQTFPYIGHKGDVELTFEIVSVKFRFIIVYAVKEEYLDIIRVFFRGQNR
ncbi:MAG: hypothetical protein COA91_07125 [Robiginitomaculum sp.]|nr:MAG: hypothetical protein COA91_07125 [Robiginitomaculum sp.]